MRSYYDTNTRLFERFGGGRDAGSVHRALWGPGVNSLREALHESHRRVGEAVLRVGARRVLDLGCGIGGALAYVLAHSGVEQAVGLTLSPEQAGRALTRARTSQIVLGDYHALPLCAQFDVAFAIESFAHAAQPARFFAEAARCLRPGGTLVLIDDTLAEASPASSDARRWLAAFRDGWRVPSVLTVDAIVDLAAAAGLALTATEDLTDQLRLRALPDALARMLVDGLRLAGGSAAASASAGSVALQQLYARGAMRYRQMEFRRG
jgi:cyclopropane fatty-acyl-phospholipid synthase-like methyltransferase